MVDMLLQDRERANVDLDLAFENFAVDDRRLGVSPILVGSPTNSPRMERSPFAHVAPRNASTS